METMIERFMVYNTKTKEWLKDENGKDVIGEFGDVEDYLDKENNIEIHSLLNGMRYTYRDIYDD